MTSVTEKSKITKTKKENGDYRILLYTYNSERSDWLLGGQDFLLTSRRVFWVVGKSNNRVGENNNWTKDNYIFNNWKINLEWPFYYRNSRALIG